VVPQPRRRPAGVEARALVAPDRLAGPRLECLEERALLVVRDEDQLAAGDDRRGRGAEGVLRQRERALPQLLAGEVVARETERTEVDDHVLAIRRGRGRGRRVLLLVALERGGLQRALPQDLAVAPVDAHGAELAVLAAGDERARLRQARR